MHCAALLLLLIIHCIQLLGHLHAMMTAVMQCSSPLTIEVLDCRTAHIAYSQCQSPVSNSWENLRGVVACTCGAWHDQSLGMFTCMMALSSCVWRLRSLLWAFS